MSDWECWSWDFGVLKEFWGRRKDRKISPEEEGLGFTQYVVSTRSEQARDELIEEQDLLEAKYNGARGETT